MNFLIENDRNDETSLPTPQFPSQLKTNLTLKLSTILGIFFLTFLSFIFNYLYDFPSFTLPNLFQAIILSVQKSVSVFSSSSLCNRQRLTANILVSSSFKVLAVNSFFSSKEHDHLKAKPDNSGRLLGALFNCYTAFPIPRKAMLSDHQNRSSTFQIRRVAALNHQRLFHVQHHRKLDLFRQ